MINTFKWSFCFLLVLSLQLAFSPLAVVAVAEVSIDGAEFKNLPADDSSDAKQTVARQQFSGGFLVPQEQSLSDLIGVSEVSVLENVDGQFVKNMAAIQLVDEGLANQVGETNLTEAVRVGRSFNRESLAAQARTEQAKARTGQAFGLLLPSVSMRIASGTEKSEPSVIADEATGELIASDTHTRTDIAVTVRQPLFDLPRFLEWRRREVVEQARGDNYRGSDSDAYLSTTNAYLSMVSSRLQADVTEDFETQLAELLNYIEKRASAGAASVSDMSRVRARIQQTLSSRLEQESAHASAGIEFVRLTNIVPQRVRLPILDDVGIRLLPATFDQAVATAMMSNPEITAISTELQAAKIDQSAAKGRYLPRLDAEYTYTYAYGAGGDQSPDGQTDQRIMAVINWDLFSGGSDYRYNDERRARVKELQYRQDDQRRRVVQALSANYSALKTTRERLDSGYDELKSIATAAEAMSKRMLSGNQSLLDLLDVYDRYYQARSRLVSLHILEMNAVAQLIRLTQGTPWATAEDRYAVAAAEPPVTPPAQPTPEVNPVRASPESAESRQPRPELLPLQGNDATLTQQPAPAVAESGSVSQQVPQLITSVDAPVTVASPLLARQQTTLVKPLIETPVTRQVSSSTDNPMTVASPLLARMESSPMVKPVVATPVAGQAPSPLSSINARRERWQDNGRQEKPGSDKPPAKSLVLGVAPGLNGILTNQRQGEQLAAYLEDTLPLTVTVREFSTVESFSEWFKVYRMVDLAIMTPAVARESLGSDYLSIATVMRIDKAGAAVDGLVVVPHGQNKALLASLQQVFIDMNDSSAGQTLMTALNINKMALPEVVTVKPAAAERESVTRSVTPVMKRNTPLPEMNVEPAVKPVAPVPFVSVERSHQQVVFNNSAIQADAPAKKMVLGIVTGSHGFPGSLQQAEQLADFLQGSLTAAVTVREFSNIEQLSEWFRQYRMVDFAFLSPVVARQQLGRDYQAIARFVRTDKSATDAVGQVVVPADQDEELFAKLQQSLVGMAETERGQALMRVLKISEMSVPQPVISQPYVAPGRPAGMGSESD